MRLAHPIVGQLVKEANDKVFIVSDLHLNHDKEFLWGSRAKLIKDYNIKNVSDYSYYILNSLSELGNSQNGEAYLISLGDNCFNDREGEWLNKFASLPFKKIYTLPGNHTSGFNTNLNGYSSEYGNIQLLSHNIPFRIQKSTILCLSHYPLVSVATGIYGTLCGHCHGAMKELNIGNDSYGRIFDCGVDNALKDNGKCYFTLERALSILETKSPQEHSALFDK